MSASAVQSRLSLTDSTYNLGTKDSKLYVGAGNVTNSFSNLANIHFANVSATSTDFIFEATNVNRNIYVTLDGGSSIHSLTLKGIGIGDVKISGGANISNGLILDSTTAITSLSITGAGSFVSQITSGSGCKYANNTTTGCGKIERMVVGDAGVFLPFIGSNYIKADITSNLTINSVPLTIDSSDTAWNQKATTDAMKGQHITIVNTTEADVNIITLGKGNVYLSIGPNATRGGQYKYQNLVLTGDGDYYNPAQAAATSNYEAITAAPGVRIERGKDSFVLQADVATSYGASMYRALALGYMRRSTMTQNLLDTMTTKTFHSDRYYNQEVELRLLQYDMNRLTNRNSKFAKHARKKNQKEIDKMREKMARLTLEQSKGQHLDKSYNNFELIDELDVIFIPYTGRRDWRLFALPYATHSYVDLGNDTAMEYAGGALFGIQRNLRLNGIFGGYVGYEFAHTDTTLVGAPTQVQTNSLQIGANYYKAYAVPAKVWEGFIKANIRGGVDLPRFRFEAGGKTNTITSNSPDSSVPLMWSVGAEVKGGITFYQYKRNSYLSPEISLSYDLLSSLKMKFEKPIINVDGANFFPLGANEYYKNIYWSLPQLGASVRYYKIWGNTFRTNIKAGVRYNIINTQKAELRIGENFTDVGTITLPAVYGNLAFDFVWMIKKNHELSFGYDGLFYASTFEKTTNAYGKKIATNDWFNGVTTTLNFKYAYWFGGSDYVTDKDGNAVARSIAEGGKKKSKSKKSKKKVYYIDG